MSTEGAWGRSGAPDAAQAPCPARYIASLHGVPVADDGTDITSGSFKSCPMYSRMRQRLLRQFLRHVTHSHSSSAHSPTAQPPQNLFDRSSDVKNIHRFRVRDNELLTNALSCKNLPVPRHKHLCDRCHQPLRGDVDHLAFGCPALGQSKLHSRTPLTTALARWCGFIRPVALAAIVPQLLNLSLSGGPIEDSVSCSSFCHVDLHLICPS